MYYYTTRTKTSIRYAKENEREKKEKYFTFNQYILDMIVRKKSYFFSWILENGEEGRLPGTVNGQQFQVKKEPNII